MKTARSRIHSFEEDTVLTLDAVSISLERVESQSQVEQVRSKHPWRLFQQAAAKISQCGSELCPPNHSEVGTK